MLTIITFVSKYGSAQIGKTEILHIPNFIFYTQNECSYIVHMYELSLRSTH